MKLFNSIQLLSIVCLGLFTLLILGAEPTDLTNYDPKDYEHHAIVLCWFWVGSAITLIMSSIAIKLNKRG